MIWYEEHQKINQWWVWVVILLSIAITMVAVYPLFGTDDAWVAYISISTVVGLAVWLASVTLRTRIGDQHIEVLYGRLFRRCFDRDDIVDAYVRTYQPLGEYGGWGVRWAPGSSSAYTVSGNQGLQLKLRDGSRFLVGTQRPEELRERIEAWLAEAPGPTALPDLERLPDAHKLRQ